MSQDKKSSENYDDAPEHSVTVHHSLMQEKPDTTEDDTAEGGSKNKTEDLSHATAPTLQPLDPSLSAEAKSKQKDEQPQPSATTDNEASVAEATGPEDFVQAEDTTDVSPKPKAAPQDTDAAQVKHDAEVRALIASKKYLLPIKTPEDRQTKRMVMAGAVAALLLIVVWLDIALDAHILKLGGLKPVTHFFSN
jgi:hypothetical protein